LWSGVEGRIVWHVVAYGALLWAREPDRVYRAVARARSDGGDRLHDVVDAPAVARTRRARRAIARTRRAADARLEGWARAARYRVSVDGRDARRRVARRSSRVRPHAR